MRRFRWELLASIGLSALTIGAFWVSTRNGFVNIDDDKYVYENPQVLRGLTASGCRWALTTIDFCNWHPLTWLSLQLDASLFGPNAFGFHLTNLLLHAANTVGLFWFLRLATGARWRSMITAALFGVHPLHVESVAWIAERKDVLSGLFWMLTLLAYLAYVHRPGVARYLLVVAALGIGLLAKPMLVTLPFVLLLLDYWPFRRPQTWRRLIVEKAPLFAMVLASSVITWHAQRAGGAIAAGQQYSLGARLANAILCYEIYLEKMIWPLELAVYYPHPGPDIAPARVVLAGLLLAAITGLCVRARRSRPYLPMGWFWYLGTLVPVIGMVQVGTQGFADRYTYIPLIGIFLMIAWGCADMAARSVPAGRITVVLSSGIIAGCVVLTVRQVPYWHDSVTLFQHALDVTGPTSFSYVNLGLGLFEKEEFAEGVGCLKKALELDPQNDMVRVNLAEILIQQGRVAEGVPYLRDVVRARAGSFYVRVLLGEALEKEGQDDEARFEYEQALRANSRFARARYRLGALFYRHGKLDQALAQLVEAIRTDPNYGMAYYDLGLVCAELGRKDDALTSFRNAAKLGPRNLRYRLALAWCLARFGQMEEAAAQYEICFQIDRGWPPDNAQRAWRLATQAKSHAGDARQAVLLSEQACQATRYTQPELLDKLAAAYAAAGRFDRAVENARKALEICASANRAELVPQIRAHLHHYEAKEPVRDRNLP